MSESSTRDSLSSVSDTVDGVSTPDNVSLASSLSSDSLPTGSIPGNVVNAAKAPAINSGSSSNPEDQSINGSIGATAYNIHTSIESVTSVDTDTASYVSDTESISSRTRPNVQPTLEDVQQLLTCTACNKTFDNPKVLICFHSFCAKCVQTYREGSEDFVICSHCRTCQPLPPTGVEGLSPSYTIEDLLDITQTSHGAPNQCQACEKLVNPEFICTTCNVAICKPCQVAHTNLRITKNHTILPIGLASATPLSMYAGKRVVMCKEHEDMVLYRCVPCGLFLCHTDWNSQHRNHEIESVAEVRNRMKRNAAELERKVKQSILSSKSAESLGTCRREKLQEKFDEMEQVIDRVVAETDRCVRSAAEELKTELRGKKQGEDDKISGVISDSAQRLQSSQHLRRMLLSVSKESNDIDALTFLSYCEQKYDGSRHGMHANKILDSDIIFIKSKLLCQVLSAAKVGEVREIGRYPPFKTPGVLASFDVIANITGIAINKYKEVICLSYHDRKCVMYDERGHIMRDLSHKVVRPWDVTFADDGTFIITDCGDTVGHGSVKKFSPAGSLIKVIETNVKSPAGITVDRSGRMFVCYDHNCVVKVSSTDGRLYGQLKTWNDDYLFQGPIYVDVNINNDVVVCDDHRCVKIISPVGEVKEIYDVDSRSELHSVMTDDQGQILVVDSQKNGIHVLTINGRLRRFVSIDHIQGLGNIRCACITPFGQVMVAGNAKVFVLEIFS